MVVMSEEVKMQTMSSIRKDFVATHIRVQLERLRNILESVEECDAVDSTYAEESLRRIESDIRSIRKICLNN